MVGSGSNLAGNEWIGKNVRRGFDEVIFRFAPHTDVPFIVDDKHNRIDHFDVR